MTVEAKRKLKMNLTLALGLVILASIVPVTYRATSHAQTSASAPAATLDRKAFGPMDAAKPAVVPATPAKALGKAPGSPQGTRSTLPPAPPTPGAVSGAPAAPGSQPSPAPSLDLNDPSTIVKGLVWAFGSKSWPFMVLVVLGGLLWLERNFKMLFGEKSSRWLNTKWGLALSGALMTAFGGGMAVWRQGWKALVPGLIIGAVVGGVQALVQYGKSPPAPVAPPTP